MTAGCPPTAERQKTTNPLSHPSCASKLFVMPCHTQPDLVVVSLKSLGYATLMAAGSKASPISILRSISPRGMGITSPSEGRMTIKVGCPLVVSGVLDSDISDPAMALEHVRVAVCCCGYNNRRCRFRMEARPISSAYVRKY